MTLYTYSTSDSGEFQCEVCRFSTLPAGLISAKVIVHMQAGEAAHIAVVKFVSVMLVCFV